MREKVSDSNMSKGVCKVSAVAFLQSILRVMFHDKQTACILSGQSIIDVAAKSASCDEDITTRLNVTPTKQKIFPM